MGVAVGATLAVALGVTVAVNVRVGVSGTVGGSVDVGVAVMVGVRVIVGVGVGTKKPRITSGSGSRWVTTTGGRSTKRAKPCGPWGTL